MTKKDIEKQNEQIRQEIITECEKLQTLEEEQTKRKEKIRYLNRKIDNNYEKYYTL